MPNEIFTPFKHGNTVKCAFCSTIHSRSSIGAVPVTPYGRSVQLTPLCLRCAQVLHREMGVAITEAMSQLHSDFADSIEEGE